MNLAENIDKTINAICDWIQEVTKANSPAWKTATVPEMTKALAELITASAHVQTRKL